MKANADESNADKLVDLSTSDSDVEEYGRYRVKEAARTPLAVIPEDEAAVEQASETPLADIFISKASMSIDEESNDNDKTLLQWTAELLWRGNYKDKASGEYVPHANVARLEKLLSETARVRQKYHRELFSANILADLDSERDLTTWEAQEIHNAWMNDVDDWMDSECLQKYTDLIKEANAAKGSAGKPAKGSAGKPVKGNAGKLAKGNGGKTAKGDAGKAIFFNGVDSELARAFQAGTLKAEVTQLEQQFGYRKQMGLTHLLSST